VQKQLNDNKWRIMARDVFHNAVRRALEKEGWLITADPLYLKFGRDPVLIDLAANRLLAASQGEQHIAVEIKSFIQNSTLHEFHAALGQYLNYRVVLGSLDPDRMLFLAVPLEVYERFFSRELAQASVAAYQVRLLVYEIENEVIAKWA
jgi:hypothetical protein